MCARLKFKYHVNNSSVMCSKYFQIFTLLLSFFPLTIIMNIFFSFYIICFYEIFGIQQEKYHSLQVSALESFDSVQFVSQSKNFISINIFLKILKRLPFDAIYY